MKAGDAEATAGLDRAKTGKLKRPPPAQVAPVARRRPCAPAPARVDAAPEPSSPPPPWPAAPARRGCARHRAAAPPSAEPPELDAPPLARATPTGDARASPAGDAVPDATPDRVPRGRRHRPRRTPAGLRAARGLRPRTAYPQQRPRAARRSTTGGSRPDAPRGPAGYPRPGYPQQGYEPHDTAGYDPAGLAGPAGLRAAAPGTPSRATSSSTRATPSAGYAQHGLRSSTTPALRAAGLRAAPGLRAAARRLRTRSAGATVQPRTARAAAGGAPRRRRYRRTTRSPRSTTPSSSTTRDRHAPCALPRASFPSSLPRSGRATSIAVVAPSSPFEHVARLVRARLARPALPRPLHRGASSRARVTSPARTSAAARSSSRRSPTPTCAPCSPPAAATAPPASCTPSRLRVRGARRRPRWIVGFSDITALHVEAARVGVASIHGPHLTTVGRGDARAREALVRALEDPLAPRTYDGPRRRARGRRRGPPLRRQPRAAPRLRGRGASRGPAGRRAPARGRDGAALPHRSHARPRSPSAATSRAPPRWCSATSPSAIRAPTA